VSDAGALRSARAVRERAQAMLALAERDALAHFRVDWSRLPAVVDRVLAVTRARYPDPAAIPPHARWRHFDAGGVDRLSALDARLRDLPVDEALRARFDLVVTSVLLDAGAGPRWSYREPGTDRVLTRSEGLAVASLHAFLAGTFSSDPRRQPLRADADGLRGVTEESLARAFQAEDGSLAGLAGRAQLIRRLGEVVAASPRYFGGGPGARVGNLADHLLRKTVRTPLVVAGLIENALDALGLGQTPSLVPKPRPAGTLSDAGRPERAPLAAPDLLTAVLDGLGPIWPGRVEVDGINLGDTWPHPQLGLVPFHKLSQWLSYSLIEPLEAAGVRVVAVDGLTGLAEYRNGGLFLDGGVLVAKDDRIFGQTHAVDAPLVVEWRALTVALLDRTAAEMRARLGLSAEALPLAKVLEGGTWQAGRALAAEKRSGGGPPLEVSSDGTVF
jgi:hypothetical protein